MNLRITESFVPMFFGPTKSPAVPGVGKSGISRNRRLTRRPLLKYLLFSALLVTVLAAGPRHLTAAEEAIDSIAAIVDDEIILESEIGYGISTLLLENEINYPTPEQIDQMRNQVLNAYINQKILLAKAVEETLTVEDRVVEKELERKLQDLTARVGSADKLVEYFGRPMRQIKREMRQGVHDGLLIEMLKQGRIGRVHVSRRQVVEFYERHADELPTLPEQVALSHILLLVEPSDSSVLAAENKIREIRRSLLEGADFDSLAAAESEDPSASDGGRLGFTNRGDLVPAYEEAAYALEPGEISDVVKTPYGLHVIRLIERQGERISTQHILVQLKPTESDWERVIDQAVELEKRIQSGEPFAAIAREYSQDEESADKGGKLVTMPLANLPPEFKTAIEGLQPGDLTMPFRSQFGVHILRVDGGQEARRLNLEDDWQIIENMALADRRESEFNKWVNTLRKDHYIFPPE